MRSVYEEGGRRHVIVNDDSHVGRRTIQGSPAGEIPEHPLDHQAGFLTPEAV